MTRALVLGGGGPVGVAWESGLVAGLTEAGVDLKAAEAVIGTSAGSFVGAQLTAGVDLKATVDRMGAPRTPVASGANSAFMAERMQRLMEAMAAAALSEGPPEEARKAIGKLALESEGLDEEEFAGFFEVLDGCEWPEQFACTAVDAHTGEFVIWRADDEADLAHAVASSCAVPGVFPAITIAGRRFIDGGMRSPLNADVAVGHDRVVVVSVMALSLPEGVSNPIFDALLGRVTGELDTLRAAGAEVELIEPDDEFLEYTGWGISLMDASKAGGAYELGLRRGADEAARVGKLWA